ncbi:MAG: dTDP-4-dehydrorhamnose reductase [Deltaproteobacteria bacterium]|nr:dTDP-4-dehydrorhamnose reductase [Deltaproteobacteria bacterium]
MVEADYVRVLIVGARGMLGSDLMQSLSDTQQVVGTDIEDFDITDRKETLGALSRIRPEWVINAAAYTQVDRCEEESELAFKVNAEGVKNLALACKDIQARLFHVSTDYIFDGKKEEPYVEEDTPLHISVYGHSKLKGESYVQDLLDDFVIVRSGGLYGKGGSNFVNTIIKVAKEKDELTVVDDQWVAPTYTIDLSRAIGALMEVSARGIFHVVNSGCCNWYQFAGKILSLVGSTSKVIPISSDQLNRPAKRPGFSALNCRKFTEVTGNKLRSWEEALTDYISLF